MKKYIFLIIFISLFAIVSVAQNEKFSYSGGMLFLQPGYTIYTNKYQNVKELSFGLGGILRFYPTEHFTVGLAGGNQKSNYSTISSNNSYITIGYGGIILGYTFAKNKMRFCSSLGFARGRIKNLHISQQSSNFIDDGSFYNYGAWVAYPSLSFDYMLTKKISFTTQLIYLSAVYNENDLYFCPVFQLGVLFNR